jgi:G:T-mismatch repair DNA endonuclease (very short patch repair protein)
MTDVLTRAQRSYNMSRIRYRDTGPELKVIGDPHLAALFLLLGSFLPLR